MIWRARQASASRSGLMAISESDLMADVKPQEAIATQEEAQPPMELTVLLNPIKQLVQHGRDN